MSETRGRRKGASVGGRNCGDRRGRVEGGRERRRRCRWREAAGGRISVGDDGCKEDGTYGPTMVRGVEVGWGGYVRYIYMRTAGGKGYVY